MRELQGDFDATGQRYAIVATRWNEALVDRLVSGAASVLADCGVADGDITVVRVPGAFEIPLAVDRLADGGGLDGIVAVGTVIRGETPHFDYVAGECARGLSTTTLEYGIPVGFGVITAENPAQAEARAGDDEDSNKGAEGASAAVEMATLLARIDAR
ncbi:6,7-dimethyl-8-ribityllumazine synthase [Salinisphaera orenii]|uniref:6,7-dimethyl-8-ribityllumazine synthase n=1 Tax=Salinisphaera orenii TaxID=856731 RepID=UPI000DBE0188